MSQKHKSSFFFRTYRKYTIYYVAYSGVQFLDSKRKGLSGKNNCLVHIYNIYFVFSVNGVTCYRYTIYTTFYIILLRSNNIRYYEKQQQFCKSVDPMAWGKPYKIL